MNATVVVNIRNAPKNWQTDPQYVYIGRPGRGFSGEFGNRHEVGTCIACQYRHHTRDAAIELHAAELCERFLTDVGYRQQVESLRGKYLVCFCWPKRCHGENYVEILRSSSPL